MKTKNQMNMQNSRKSEPTSHTRTLILRPAQHNETLEAASLLGTGLVYRGPEPLTDFINSDNGLVLVAYYGEEMVAVSTAVIVTDLKDILPPGQDEIAVEMNRFSPIGVMKQAVTKPEARSQGIVTHLIAQELEWMQTLGVKLAYGDAWVRPDGKVPAAGLLTRNGFTHHRRVVNFWKQESEEQGYGCNECGNPCRCAADIYIKHII